MATKTTKPTGSFRARAMEQALERIKIAEARIVALHYACGSLRVRDPVPGFSELHALLYKELNEAFRQLLLFGVLVPDAMQARVRKKVLHHYFHEGMSIMGYLTIDGELPRGWSGTEEEEFRAELKSYKEENK